MKRVPLEKNIEKYTLVNTGRIMISLVFLMLVFYFKLKYPVIYYGCILHLVFSVIWFVIIQFDIFIEENHNFSGYVPCTLDVVVSTAFILITGNIYSPLVIAYVIITALTSVVIHKYVSIYTTFLIIFLYITMGVLTIKGYIPDINLFSGSAVKPDCFLLVVSSGILSIGLLIVRNIVRRFVKYNADLYRIAERERKKAEKLLVELQDNYSEIEIRNDMLKRDLQLARSIQLSLIPSPPKNIEGLVIAAVYHPMHEVGGDFYDFIFFKETKNIGMFISDVSGHGIPAALITSMLKTLINTAGKERTETDTLLSYINRNLYDQTNQNFITAIYGIYNTVDRVFTFSRAGHPPIILLRENRIEYITGKGGLLAIRENVEFEVKSVQLNKGDKVLLVTDGLLEAAGKNGSVFDEAAISEVINVHIKLPVEEFVQRLFSDLVEFHGGINFEDDICIVGFEVN